MLRDPNLAPLSREHQHGLALCVRLRRRMAKGALSPEELAAFREEVADFYTREAEAHFHAEEELVFPLAERDKELRDLTAELRRQHMELRRRMTNPQAGDDELAELAERLSAHIRMEENELFQQMQARMPAQLAQLGLQLERVLAGASCRLPGRQTS